MRFELIALAVVACSPSPPPPDVTRELQARLAVVARPEPGGAIEVTRAASLEGPTRIARDDVFIDVTALDTSDGEVVRTVSRGRYEELRRVHHALRRIELRYSVVLGGSLSALRVVDDYVEVLDARGVARLRTEPAFAVDAIGTIRKLAPSITGRFVSWSAAAGDLVPPIAIDPAWTATKSLAKATARAAAFALPGGKVIVSRAFEGDASTELYDDATASWTAGPPMLHVRRFVKPVQLDDGSVFVAAGASDEVPPAGEIYDPKTNKWRATTASPYPYATPISAPLKGSRVLVVANAGASIYDASTNTWTKTGALVTPRRPARMVGLGTRALIVAGATPTGEPLSSAELYDDATGTFAAAGALSAPRAAFALQVLSDGRVAAIGGSDQTDLGTYRDVVEIFHQGTKTWSPGPKLSKAGVGHGAVVMADGRLLLAGGVSESSLLSAAEILDSMASKWIPAGALTEPRADFPIVAVSAKRYFAIGGYNGGGSTTVDAFELLTNGSACKDAGECASVSCADGRCCEKSSCAADETCGGATALGRCSKKAGNACSAGAQCGSGICVDGVCCDRACDGLCEACDLAANKGTCATLAPGDSPHGARAKCPGEGACAALCGGVDAKSCTLFPGGSTECGVAACADGAESSSSTCNGAGLCTLIPARKCEPFVCGERSCKRACAADADCAPGYSCDVRSGRCVFGAKCDGDHVVTVPGGGRIECAPFKCGGASCLTTCATTNDCVSGTTCDTASGACVVGGSATDDGGGCAYGARAPGGLAAAVMFLAAALRRARAR